MFDQKMLSKFKRVYSRRHDERHRAVTRMDWFSEANAHGVQLTGIRGPASGDVEWHLIVDGAHIEHVYTDCTEALLLAKVVKAVLEADLPETPDGLVQILVDMDIKYNTKDACKAFNEAQNWLERSAKSPATELKRARTAIGSAGSTDKAAIQAFIIYLSKNRILKERSEIC